MNELTERENRDLHLGILVQDDVKVWRYIDFAKFVALLNSEALYFFRADLFDDNFEGSFTHSSVEYRERIWREAMPSMPNEAFRGFVNVHKFQKEEERKNFYVNCWHMNDHESVAMWDLYGLKGQSLAIQSSYRTLRKVMPRNQSPSGQPLEGHVDIGIVQYLDYENDPMPQIYSFDPFLRKRKSYEHERELRLFAQAEIRSGSYQKDSTNGSYVFVPSNGEPIENSPGIEIQVDLQTLIQNIYVAPNAPAWFLKLVQSVLNKYGVDKEAKSSNLTGSPVY